MNRKLIAVGLPCAILLGFGIALWLVNRVPEQKPQDKALFAAIKSKENTTLALPNGADVNAKDEYGFTPLTAAVYYSKPDAIPALLEKGADINARNQGGETALMVAVNCHQIAAIRILLQRHADVNLKDSRGDTALSRAQRFRKRDMITLLQEAGARP